MFLVKLFHVITIVDFLSYHITLVIIMQTCLLLDGVDPPEQRVVPPPAGVGGVPRGGPDHQGIHAGGNHHRPQVAGRVCPRLFQVGFSRSLFCSYWYINNITQVSL